MSERAKNEKDEKLPDFAEKGAQKTKLEKKSTIHCPVHLTVHLVAKSSCSIHEQPVFSTIIKN